jgi:HAD superfamily hydrolase (TIGR01549 family)
MNKNKLHFLFDLDDTLADSYNYNQQIFVDVFSPYLDLSNKEIEQFLRTVHFSHRGTSMSSQFQKVIEQFNLQVKASQLEKANEALNKKNVHNVPMFTAVEELMKTLKSKNKKISLLSNRQGGSLKKILDNHKIAHYFTNVISCADEGHEKPDPFCLNKIIAESKDPKDAFIYFGDSKTDYDFAHAAGIDALIVDHYLNGKNFYRMILESFI